MILSFKIILFRHGSRRATFPKGEGLIAYAM